MFDEWDEGFMSTVNSLMATTKRPIILTATHASPILFSRIKESFEVMEFVKPPQKLTGKYVLYTLLPLHYPMNLHAWNLHAWSSVPLASSLDMVAMPDLQLSQFIHSFSSQLFPSHLIIVFPSSPYWYGCFHVIDYILDTPLTFFYTF